MLEGMGDEIWEEKEGRLYFIKLIILKQNGNIKKSKEQKHGLVEASGEQKSARRREMIET